jgi:putative restriction endonuclease
MLQAMEWLEKVARMRRWTRGGERDPNRALLLLYALGQLYRSGYQALPFRELEEPFGELLAEFRPAKPVSPGYAFHQLAADGLWEVLTARGPGSPGPDAETLRAYDAAGRLAPRFAKELLADPAVFAETVRLVLELNFAPGLHLDLRTAVGLPLEPAVPAEVSRLLEGMLPRSRPDVLLRQKVLVAYDCRCAFCGYEGWIGNSVVGLEAARLRWWAFGGHDDLSNALCLCTLHHQLLDRGVLGVSRSGSVLVSSHFVGLTEAAHTLVTALSGQRVLAPQVGFPPPHRTNIDWHIRQVFRGPARTS